MVVALAVVLALPATIQFAWKKARLPYDPVPAPMVRAMDALAAASRPGDVVLQRPGARYPPLPVVLIGRRVPYERFTPWLTQFAPRGRARARGTSRCSGSSGPATETEAMAIAPPSMPASSRFTGRIDCASTPRARWTPIYEDGPVRILRIIPAAE